MLRDQSMPEVALRPRSLWSARLLQLAVVAGLLALGALAWWALGIAHWRHDSFAYSSERQIWFKIRSEGRWLNYLAWWCLRSVSPHLAWGTNLCIVGGALYLIISRLVEDRLVAAVLAITLLLFPGFHAQNMWPLYTLVGSAAFLVSVLLIQRHGWIWVVPGCVLICGAVQYAVFLLPLAVLPLSKESASSGLLRGALLGLYWAAGAALGMLISCAVNRQIMTSASTRRSAESGSGPTAEKPVA